ncbi:MAG: hypothetical protein N2489_00570 [Clostridia bacterium]|nr:hypothetical protein [Clostridia bacterium]
MVNKNEYYRKNNKGGYHNNQQNGERKSFGEQGLNKAAPEAREPENRNKDNRDGRERDNREKPLRERENNPQRNNYMREKDNSHRNNFHNNPPQRYGNKSKAEETAEDIKADILRIEKEIDLEIKEIKSLRLGL